MYSVDPKEVSTGRFHGLMLGVVAPRPIAFVSTIDKAGQVNLSPYSFFNAFSANPPIMIFSPARRVRDNTTKHTLQNVLEVPEVVINIVNYAIVEQMSLSSTEYDKGVNEFIKAGLTEAPADLVQPPRVAESPAAFECKVKEVIRLGEEGGAGNLVVCEVLRAHFQEEILDAEQKIDPHKLDPVSRLGGNWYGRANTGLFEIAKPLGTKGIGVDQLPEAIRNSTVLTGNNLGQLANVEQLPSREAIAAFAERRQNKAQTQSLEERHRKAQALLAKGEVQDAWLTLLQ